MNRKLTAVLMILVLLFTACGGGPLAMDESAMDYPMGSPSAAPERQSNALEQEMGWGEDSTINTGDDIVRMIIYNGEITLVVKDTSAMQEEITRMIAGLEGYVSASNSTVYGDGLLRINLTVRVPAEKFHAAMEILREMSIKVTRESIYTEDVTQEYVDLESRLGALEVKAARLEELMEEAEDTEAVLAVYNELSQTQQEIEHTKGRMRYLERTSAMATITVSLVPDELSRPIEIAGWQPGGIVKRAIEALVQTFQWLIGALIWIVFLVLPVLVFLGLLLYGLIRLLRLVVFRRKAQKKGNAPENN